MREVYKIGAIIIKDRKLLVVKERNLDLLISPGGKPEGNETPQETLRRELKEELNVEPMNIKRWGEFNSKTATKENYDWITMDTYFVEIDGEIKPCSEIEDFFWIGKDYKQKNIKLAPLLKKHIVPKLIEMNLIE